MANITQRANGNYLIRVFDGRNNGKLHFVTTTYKPKSGISSTMARKSAEKYAVLFEELVRSGGYQKKMNETSEIRARRRTTVESFVHNQYYPSIQKHLSPNTCRTYELIIDSLILPSFGRLELQDINSTHLQAFVDYLSTPDARVGGKHGLSPATVKRYATVFSSIITEAWKQKYLDENPIRHGYVHFPKIIYPQLEAYSDNEVSEFVSALDEEDIRTKALLMLAVTTGLRRGEIVGLMWEDIDFEKSEINVSRSVYKLKGEKQSVKSTKSASSNRTVFMPETLVICLYGWKIEQAKQKRHCGLLWQDSDFVFTDEYGKNISIYAPTRICAEFEKRHGLRHLKLHGLRHTCGSLMVEHGVDPETVKAVLGHESLKTTNRYLHPYENSMRNASKTMDTIIKGDINGKTKNDQGGGERN